MDEPKGDLRVRKTERALINAMLELIEQKPLDEITVSDLCDTAMVRRATFYKHFKDKYDFVDFCIAKRQQLFQTDCPGYDGGEPLEDAIAVLRDMLRYLRENRTLLDQAARQSGIHALTDLFAGDLMRLLEEKARALKEAYGCLPAEPEIFAAFFSGAVLGVVRWWYTAQAPLTEDELIAAIASMMTACIPKTTKKEEGNHERKPAQK